MLPLTTHCHTHYHFHCCAIQVQNFCCKATSGKHQPVHAGYKTKFNTCPVYVKYDISLVVLFFVSWETVRRKVSQGQEHLQNHFYVWGIISQLGGKSDISAGGSGKVVLLYDRSEDRKSLCSQALHEILQSLLHFKAASPNFQTPPTVRMPKHCFSVILIAEGLQQTPRSSQPLGLLFCS